jgi:hypothetical protein
MLKMKVYLCTHSPTSAWPGAFFLNINIFLPTMQNIIAYNNSSAAKRIDRCINVRSGLPDFSWDNTTKRRKRYLIIAKLPNHYKYAKYFKIFQMSHIPTSNIPKFPISRASKIYPNWDFWYENKQSCNPAPDVKLDT